VLLTPARSGGGETARPGRSSTFRQGRGRRGRPNGWLVFALIGQLVEPGLFLVGAARLVTFPAAMILLWRRFSALD
jgi:hypothetical protein